MKILGIEITRTKQPKQKRECQHEKSRLVNSDEDVYVCEDCGVGCFYLNGKLTEITLDNMHMGAFS